VKSPKALFEEADASLSRTRDRNGRLTVLNSIVKDFMATQEDLVWLYYAHAKDTYDKFFIMQSYVAISIVNGKDKDAFNLLENRDITWPEREMILCELIFFYASQDNATDVAKIFEKGLVPKERASMKRCMIQGYVKNSHYVSLKIITDSIKDEIDKGHVYNYLAAAIVMHIEIKDIQKFMFLFVDQQSKSLILKLLAGKFLENENISGLLKFINTFIRSTGGLQLCQQVCFELAYMGRIQELTRLVNAVSEKHRKAMYPYMAKGFVNGKKIDEALIIYKSVQREEEMKLIGGCLAEWISKEGDWASLVKLFVLAKDIRPVMYPRINKAIFTLGDFSTKEFAIDTLVRVSESGLRLGLTKKFAEYSSTNEEELIYKVDKLHMLLIVNTIPNRIAIEWMKLSFETQLFLLSFHLFAQNKLEASIALRIASYLSPIRLDNQGRTLANYLNSHYYKTRVDNHYSTQHTLFFEKILPFREFNRDSHQQSLKM
jgi:hypothetical protein